MTKAPLLAHIWDRDPDDWYVEPAWCSAQLFKREFFAGAIHDPACGIGTIVHEAELAGYKASGSDIKKRKSPYDPEIVDWLTSGFDVDNIVSNPPFKHCDSQNGIDYPFVEKCLQHARKKVALLLPIKWLSGAKRSRWLEKSPLACVYILAPRPSMPPGAVIEAGVKPGGGKEDFAWLVWRRNYKSLPELHWLRRD